MGACGRASSSLRLVAAACCVVACAGASAGSGAADIALASSGLPPHKNGGTYHFPTQANPFHVRDCRYRPRADVDAERGSGWERVVCHKVCPELNPPAEELECSDDAHHVQPKAEYHAGVHYAVLFLALCLVLGALFKFCIPSWIPYTCASLPCPCPCPHTLGARCPLGPARPRSAPLGPARPPPRSADRLADADRRVWLRAALQGLDPPRRHSTRRALLQRGGAE